MSLIRLSPSSINVFIDCPRCFWLQLNKKFKRPRGIFPSLPGGMDGHYKTFADGHRTGKPVMRSILDQVATDVNLWGTVAEIKKWRAWNAAPQAEFPEYGVTLSGGLDDMVTVGRNGNVAPFDWKTSSHEARLIDTKKYKASPSNPMIPEYAGRQMDMYGLQLSENGFNLDGRGFIAWTWPTDAVETGGGHIDVPFGVKILHHEIDLEGAKQTLDRAGSCLQGEIPASSEKCEYCRYTCGYVGEVHELAKS